MVRRKAKIINLRQRILEDIDAEIDAAKEHVRLANDLTDLLNMVEDGEPPLTKRSDNIISGAFVKKEE